MNRRREQAPGGRHIMHRVKVTPEEEEIIQKKADRAGVTVSRLLAESALARDVNTNRKVLAREISGLRDDVRKYLPPDEIQAKMLNSLDKFRDH